MGFNPRKIECFRFVDYSFDQNKNIAYLRYAFDDCYFFVEQLEFHGRKLPLTSERKEALDHCLRHLHLMAGISYYKAAIPKNILIEWGNIDQDTARFFEHIYLHGLGEFSYRNQVNLQRQLRFPFDTTHEIKAANLTLARKTAIPIGGGKDSVVTLEILREKEATVLFSLGDYKPIREIASRSQIPRILVSRRISPVLLDLNQQGALNGHVPISAIIAFTLTVSAVLYDFDRAALSNERSASCGNLHWNGLEINHQYSKGLECEKMIDSHLQRKVLKNFRYFSFLRPLSELSIARLFVDCRQYHDIFTSCNHAFKIKEEERCGRWCLDCPKCRFVFLALAPFVEKTKLLDIFGANLLDDYRQIDGYDALIGKTGHKPFECVGEIEESQVAFGLLVQKVEWQKDLLVARFAHEILPSIPGSEKLKKKIFDFAADHCLDEKYREILYASFRA